MARNRGRRSHADRRPPSARIPWGRVRKFVDRDRVGALRRMVTQQSREQRRDLAVHLHRCGDGEVAVIVEEALDPAGVRHQIVDADEEERRAGVTPLNERVGRGEDPLAPIASEDEPPVAHEGEAEAERIAAEQAKVQRLHEEAAAVDAEQAVGGQNIGKTESGLGGGDVFVDNPHQGERNDGPELVVDAPSTPVYENMWPPDGTMNDVLAWVDNAGTSEDRKRRAQAALDAEDRREKPRESIKPMLNRRLK